MCTVSCREIIISQNYAARLNREKGKQLECEVRKSADKRNSISLGIPPSQEFMCILPATSKGARREPEKFSIVTVVISDFKKKLSRKGYASEATAVRMYLSFHERVISLLKISFNWTWQHPSPAAMFEMLRILKLIRVKGLNNSALWS